MQESQEGSQQDSSLQEQKEGENGEEEGGCSRCRRLQELGEGEGEDEGSEAADTDSKTASTASAREPLDIPGFLQQFMQKNYGRSGLVIFFFGGGAGMVYYIFF